jgi:hypothetical protein
MRRLIALCATVACTSGKPIAILDGGDGAASRALTFDAWNAGLGERTEPTLVPRRPKVIEAISTSIADVVCLQGVFRESDRAAIIEAARARFSHSASFHSDLGTVADDPTDQTGAIPAAETSAPCTGEATLAALQPAHECLSRECSTVPGSDAGYLTSTRCLRYSCLSQLYALLDVNQRCFACARMTSQDAPLAECRRACTEDPRAGYAFAGENDLLILSREPIAASKLYVLPSTDYRRSVIHARLASGLHVFCASLTPTFSAVDLPYTGRYGDGAIGINGWIAENLLQTKKLIALVNNIAGSDPAIVLGDLRTGPEVKSGGMTVVTAAPAFRSWEELNSRLTPGVPQNYSPLCTRCPDNPLTESTPPYWFEHALLHRIPNSRVAASSRIHTEAAVPHDGKMIARSFDYGLRTTITVP